ncbi:MAG: SIR2 family protein [Hyphomonadaceae bacterium]
MWTHRRPHQPFELTKHYIDNRGRLALSRALNIQRTIAFCGAGVSAAYGMPSWDDLVSHAIDAALDLHTTHGNPERSGYAVQAIASQLTYIQNKLNDGDSRLAPSEKTMALHLAETLADKLGERSAFREMIAEKFRPSKRVPRDPIPIPLSENKTIARKADPNAALYSTLNIRRYLTLNYDVQVETEFARHLRTTSVSDGGNKPKTLSEFDALISSDPKIHPARSPRTEYRDGSVRPVSSVALGSHNTGDLINFAMHARQASAQVFHLHGRYDLPESTVLTEKDYQRTYLSGDVENEVFNEALAGVFTANAILFVGIGMEEGDPLRPLRQLASQEDGLDGHRRQIFNLQLPSARIDDTYFEETPSGDLAGDFRKKHIPNRSEAGAPPTRNEQADAITSINLNAQYGVFTIFGRVPGALELRLLGALFRRLGGQSGKPRNSARYRIALDTLIAALPAKMEILSDDEREAIEGATAKLSALLKTGGFEPTLLEELRTFGAAFENEIRSRELELSIEELASFKESWWAEWRTLPAERDPGFNKKLLPIEAKLPMHQQKPCYSRHRQHYVIPTADWTPPKVIDDIRRAFLANQSDARRLARFTLPRGGGKGALLNLLQHADGDSSLVLDRFLPGAKRYDASFLMHLSFSMEFTSVIDALRHFVIDAIARLAVGHPGEIDAFAASIPEEEREAESVTVRLLEIVQAALMLGGGDKTFKELSETLKTFDLHTSQTQLFDKSHRVEILREMINFFTRLSKCVSLAHKPRLFICLVGIDALCDQSGNPYNPMFRSFFRLLSGNGLKYVGESNSDAPYDLLLISGDPQRPVRYLSEQCTLDELMEKTLYPVPPGGGRYAFAPEYAPLEGTALLLRKWPILPRLTFDERYWLRQSQTGEEALTARLTQLEPKKPMSAAGAPPKAGQGAPRTALMRELRSSVALHSWIAAAFAAVVEQQGVALGEDPEDDKRYIDKFLDELGSIVDRDGAKGLIRQVVRMHAETLRDTGGLKVITTSDAPPDRALVDLLQTVLSHLAIFPMPIEESVLYGCPEIKSALFRVCRHSDNPANAPKRKKDESDDAFEARKAADASKKRAQRLRALRDFLDYFTKRNLIIKVQPKRGVESDEENQHPTLWRYTLHNQLRDFIAGEMDLSVPDQGERNFFQISSYCDQPKDLPTPSPQHYELFRRIMDDQIRKCRRTLGYLYRLKVSTDERPLPADIQTKLVKRTRTFELRGAKLNGGEFVSDPDMTSYRAVSQRIRALYGMLRGSFSVGAISRLGGLAEEPDGDQPFERFRGWLRGVSNAAIGLAHVDEELKGILARTEAIRKRLPELDEPPPGDQPPPRPLSHPLYRDEIAWLLNERGLISLVQGKVFDAIPLFQRAMTVMSHRSNDGINDPALDAAVRRVTLNLAIARIDRGDLKTSARLLEGLRLPRSDSMHLGSLASWIAEGYLAHIRFLSGDAGASAMVYKKTLERARDRDVTRVVSIFERFYAALERNAGNLDSAREHARLAESAALPSEQQDLLWLAQLETARIDLAQHEGSLQRPTELVDACRRYATGMGVPKLEVECLYLEAQIMLKQGDVARAGALCAQSASIASSNGLGIGNLDALALYGRMLIKRGQFDLARSVLIEARREAERRGYQSLAGPIGDQLEEIAGI